LERFRMHYFKPIDTPVEKALTLSTDQCPKTDKEKERLGNVPYASDTESLMFVMLCTRPDICFAVGLLSPYQSNPRLAHWQAVKQIFHYLCRTSDLILCYQNGNLRLRGYTNADWGGDLDESRSASGYVVTLSGGAISWCSKKQDCKALSTMEAEYIACCLATQEAIWLRSFLQCLRLTPRVYVRQHCCHSVCKRSKIS